ncbi:MAG: prepilin-type N-terminal cleavage/methylation domain-containing protein [Candidatus Omnitrophica bacterium]|nr:prepilin-type N-terminal cleavage/methylation domain-containing protein [Candidatus Omnitrophota bacterium]
MWRTNKKAFTLVEIMIVVAIIGLLAAIAIPNFVQARKRAQTNACIANLKQIQGAISLWALDNGKKDSDAVAITDLVTTYIKATPTCPVTGSYVLTTVGANPTCPSYSATDHAAVLP